MKTVIIDGVEYVPKNNIEKIKVFCDEVNGLGEFDEVTVDHWNNANIPISLMQSDEFISLGGSAVKLFVEACRQFNGINNGRIILSWSTLKSRGWNSIETLDKAKKTLIKNGLIKKVGKARGGSFLYALTWKEKHVKTVFR